MLGDEVAVVLGHGELVHVGLSLVVNLHVLHEHVGLPEVELVDGAVEGEAEGLVVPEEAAEVLVGTGGGHVRAHDDVDLEGEAALGTLGQHQPPGHEEGSLGHVGGHLVLLQEVQQVVGGVSVVSEGQEVVGVAHDLVLALGQLVVEGVQGHEVHPVVLKRNGVAVAVVFGSQEDPDDGVGGDLRLDLDLDVEGLVVKTGLDGVEPGLDVLVLGLVALDQVGDVGLEVVEEGGEVVDLDVVDLHAGEAEGLLGVGVQVLLVLLEVVQDVLVQLVEHGVAEGGGVLLQGDGGGVVSGITCCS